MKRLWLALVCFIITASLCTFEIIYATSSVNELNKLVSQAREEFDSGKGESGKAAHILDRACKLWEEREQVMNMFLYHDSVERVGVGIKCAKSLVASEKEEADSQMIEILGLLETIKKSEQPTIENIF